MINLLGWLFLDVALGPFEVVDELVEEARRRAKVVVVDFHAEATSEKIAIARWLDGRVTAVIGTHTHVQTSDARVQPGGTAAITDAGMTGPHDSVIGVEADLAIRRMRTGMPVRFRPAEGGVRLEGVVVDCDADGNPPPRVPGVPASPGCAMFRVPRSSRGAQGTQGAPRRRPWAVGCDPFGVGSGPRTPKGFHSEAQGRRFGGAPWEKARPIDPPPPPGQTEPTNAPRHPPRRRPRVRRPGRAARGALGLEAARAPGGPGRPRVAVASPIDAFILAGSKPPA